MDQSTNPGRAARLRHHARRRRERGVTYVEYIVLLAVVVVPSISVFVLGFVRVYLWYLGFVGAVSLPSP